MTFKEIHNIIESSQVFINFKANYPNAELCAGFFVIDITNDSITKTLDYLIGDKVFTFSINDNKMDNDNNEITIQEDKLQDSSNHPGRPVLSKIQPHTNVELEELKGIVGIEALDNGIKAKFQKIIAVLQNYAGKETNNKEKQVWNLTCILDDLIILHILIDSNSKEIIKFERKNIMDWIKKVD